jgi:hypothetical protein
VFSRLGVLAATIVLAALLVVPTAGGSRNMLVGLLDETSALYGNPDRTYPMLQRLRVQVVRMDLYWGGNRGNPKRIGVAKRRPAQPRNPDDPAYNWEVYERAAHYAAQYKIKLLLTIYGTPPWANGGKPPNTAPRNARDLQNFAYAAARHFSGTAIGLDGRKVPAVRLWTAWNEPNQPFQLTPQYRRVRGRWVMQSAIDYARICNAIYAGIKSTLIAGEKVACGVTAPGGGNNPGGSRATVSPLAFLRAAKRAGMRRFDVYAHHAYPRRSSESPSSKPPKNAVTLANIGELQKEVRRLYGSKPLWITEYGYQTNPPDRLFGVSWATQARYLKQAYAMARKNPGIQMMLWFLLRDEPVLAGWQSGLMTTGGRAKPAFNAFRTLPR